MEQAARREGTGLRFVLLDPKYRNSLPAVNLASPRDAGQLIACWRGHLFYLGVPGVFSIRCDGPFARAAVRPQDQAKPAVVLSGAIGLLVQGDFLLVWTSSRVYRVPCAKAVFASDAALPEPVYSCDPEVAIAKCTDRLVLRGDGSVVRMDGGEELNVKAVDLDQDFILTESSCLDHSGALLFDIDTGRGRPHSLNVIRPGLFAVGVFDGSDNRLLLYERSGDGGFRGSDLGNVNNAYDAAGISTVVCFGPWGDYRDLLIIANSQSMELTMAGRTEGAAVSDWAVFSMTADDFTGQLPMTDAAEDTLPVCIGVDCCNTEEFVVPSEEDESGLERFPPSPVLYVLGTDKRLTAFQIVNMGSKKTLGFMDSPISVPPDAPKTAEPEESGRILTPSIPLPSDVSAPEPEIQKEENSPPTATAAVTAAPTATTTATATNTTTTTTTGSASASISVSVSPRPSSSVSTPSPPLSSLPLPPPPPPPAHDGKDRGDRGQNVGPVPLEKDQKKVDELIDTLTPKQNTILSAFLSMHTITTANLAAVKQAIEELSQTLSTLKPIASLPGLSDSVAEQYDTARKRQLQLYDLLGQTTVDRGVASDLWQSSSAQDPLHVHERFGKTQQQQLKEQLEETAAETQLFTEFCRSLDRLSLGGGRGGGERAGRLLGEGALSRIAECGSLLQNLVRSATGDTQRQSAPPPRQPSLRTAELKKTLGRRRVELHTVPLEEDLLKSPSLSKAFSSAKLQLQYPMGLPKLPPTFHSDVDVDVDVDSKAKAKVFMTPSSSITEQSALTPPPPPSLPGTESALPKPSPPASIVSSPGSTGSKESLPILAPTPTPFIFKSDPASAHKADEGGHEREKIDPLPSLNFTLEESGPLVGKKDATEESVPVSEAVPRNVFGLGIPKTETKLPAPAGPLSAAPPKEASLIPATSSPLSTPTRAEAAFPSTSSFGSLSGGWGLFSTSGSSANLGTFSSTAVPPAVASGAGPSPLAGNAAPLFGAVSLPTPTHPVQGPFSTPMAPPAGGSGFAAFASGPSASFGALAQQQTRAHSDEPGSKGAASGGTSNNRPSSFTQFRG